MKVPAVPNGPRLSHDDSRLVGNPGMMIVLGYLRFQLDLLGEELKRHVPAPDSPISHRERLRWSRARGSMKAASTHLLNLIESFNPVESAAKQARREASVERLRQHREGENE